MRLRRAQRSLIPLLWWQILGQRGSFSLADTERIFRVSKKPKRKMTQVPGTALCLQWQRGPWQRQETYVTILRKGPSISYRTRRVGFGSEMSQRQFNS